MGNAQSAAKEIRHIVGSTAEEAGLQRCSKLLAENPMLLVHRQVSSGDTLFHVTAAAGNIQALRTLEDCFRGPSSFYAHLSPDLLDAKLCQILDVANVRGETPLSLACTRGHADFAILLMSMGANPYRCDQNGLSAIHHAAREGHADCVQAALVMQLPDRCPTPLQDLTSAAGLTALHFAVAHNHHKCVEVLLEAGAKCNLRSRVFTTELGLILASGSTALHIAAKKGFSDIAMLILRYYACRERIWQQRDVDMRRVKDDNGRLPVDIARLSACSDALLTALDPSVSFEDIFTVQDLKLSGRGVTRLSVIAAAVLQHKLMADLDVASTSRLSSADTGSKSPASSSGFSGLDVPGRANSLTGTCAVCMERTPDVRTGACGHQLCGGCARQLCSRIGDRPPTCPFCRRSIGAFEPSSAQEAQV